MNDIQSAAELLLALIYPITEEDMTAEQKTEFDFAAEEQLRYSTDHTGVIKSEAVGDVKISYDVEGGAKRKQIFLGQPLSPAAVIKLTRAGLLRRWV